MEKTHRGRRNTQVNVFHEAHHLLRLRTESDEKYIVLIFENGLAMNEQLILEDILSEIGKHNNLSDFPTKLLFEDANIRLVNYNKASKEKEDKVSPTPCTPTVVWNRDVKNVADELVKCENDTETLTVMFQYK